MRTQQFSPYFSLFRQIQRFSPEDLCFSQLNSLASHIQGLRNDFRGEVGFEFKAQSSFIIRALGRGQTKKGVRLQEEMWVHLWNEEERWIASVKVGRQSIDDNRGYQYTELDQAVQLAAGKFYRLTQRTKPGMKDKWQDVIPLNFVYNSGKVSEFRGCYSDGLDKYPDGTEGRNRRLGMLTFYHGQPIKNKLKIPGSHFWVSNVFDEHWQGRRNDFNGEVGFEFKAQSSFSIISLGRAQSQKGVPLRRDKEVTLWDTQKRQPIVSISIGPQHPVDSAGYQYAVLESKVRQPP